jgi:hypothetical protein
MTSPLGYFNYGPGKLPHSVPKVKASLWAENCPNFFLFGPGQAPKGPEKTKVFFRESFLWEIFFFKCYYIYKVLFAHFGRASLKRSLWLCLFKALPLVPSSGCKATFGPVVSL